MSGAVIVTVYVVVDDVMRALGHRSHPAARLSDAAVLTVAVVAALSFPHHHARARQVLIGRRYLANALSASRFNRRLHAPGAWRRRRPEALGAAFARGEAFLLASLPLPVCRRVRARRCRTVRGAEYCGDGAAKRAKVFGWRRRRLGTLDGVPVAFDLLPASLHDLTPVHDLPAGLPAGASVYADKAYSSAADEASILADAGVRLVPQRRANMRPNLWADKLAIREFRKRIETLTSCLEALGLQRLRARTTAGFELKVHASLLALACANAR
jgi:hypothetical protein